MSSRDDRSAVEAIVAGVALGAVAEQRQSVKDLRDRAGLVLTAGSIAASFLGTRMLDAHSGTLMAWLTGAAFLVFVMAMLAVLLFDSGITLRNDEVLFDYLRAGGDDPAETHRRLACLAVRVRLHEADSERHVQVVYRTAVFALAGLLLLFTLGLVTE